jgi:hypothetical protein
MWDQQDKITWGHDAAYNYVSLHGYGTFVMATILVLNTFK